jgi:citrate lyase subunit beta/citryl-CoA lyase
MANPLITLYTPGTKPDLMRKAARYAPDAIIIDLEDTVPVQLKAQVRAEVGELIPTLDVEVLVRVNSEPENIEADLEAVVSADLRAVIYPMAEDVATVEHVDTIITRLERERSLEPDSIKLILLIETALGVVRCFDCASAATRIESMAFGSAEDADLQRDLKCAWSVEGTEMLYARSKVLLDSRAAGLPYVLDGAFSDIGNDDALFADCRLSKSLGYDGRTLIHPNQIETARRAYAPSEKEVAYYTKVAEAFEEAEAKGIAAIKVEGKLIDYAMYKMAKAFIQA